MTAQTASKFALRAQHLSGLVRSSIDNVRGATEIAEMCGRLERHSYNVSLVTSRHRTIAQAFVPLSLEIIRVTAGLQQLAGRFVDQNHAILAELVRYTRALRCAGLLGLAAGECCRQDRANVPFSDDEVALLGVRFSASFYQQARLGPLPQAPAAVRTAVEAVRTTSEGLNRDATSLHERYLALEGTDAAIGRLLQCGRYAADLGAMEARKLFGAESSAAHTASDLCALLGVAQERRQGISARIHDVQRLLPRLRG